MASLLVAVLFSGCASPEADPLENHPDAGWSDAATAWTIQASQIEPFSDAGAVVIEVTAPPGSWVNFTLNLPPLQAASGATAPVSGAPPTGRSLCGLLGNVTSPGVVITPGIQQDVELHLSGQAVVSYEGPLSDGYLLKMKHSRQMEEATASVALGIADWKNRTSVPRDLLGVDATSPARWRIAGAASFSCFSEPEELQWERYGQVGSVTMGALGTWTGRGSDHMKATVFAEADAAIDIHLDVGDVEVWRTQDTSESSVYVGHCLPGSTAALTVSEVASRQSFRLAGAIYSSPMADAACRLST